MRKNTLYVIAILAIISATFLVSTKVVGAQVVASTTGATSTSGTGQGTIVSYFNDSGRVDVDRIWTKEGSPYYIDGGVSVDADLTIDPGVEIIGIKSAVTGKYGDINVARTGRLNILGKRDNRIKISNINSIYISYGGEIRMENVDISGVKDKIQFHKAKGIIATSTIKNGNIGIQITDSEVSVQGSRFEGNNESIKIVGNYIYPDPTILPMRIHINNNSIRSLYGYPLRSSATEYMDFTGNWWGSDSGPSQNFSSQTGYMVYSKFSLIDPWLTKEPEFDPEPPIEVPKCCSNILFIPGLQASRLWRDEWTNAGAMGSGVYGFATTTHKIWEPVSNDNVRALYSDSQGESLDAAIYPGGPIDNVFGMDIYGSFMSYLDSLKVDGKIKDWKSYGYDWRKPIARLVAGDMGTSSLLQVFQELASSSPTGKVTLIAHSNGGLVMKYLVKTLVDMGKSDLVDKAISVAVPYIGTPKVILGLLHGYDQSIVKGLILKESTARGLGENMASAYSLLPSLEYFKKVFEPTIAFASTTVVGVNNGSYSQNIISGDEQSAFIEDTSNVRATPSFTDTSKPIKGNIVLNLAANYLHGILDPFVWPTSIARYALVGWGKDTPTGVVYDKKQKCTGVLFSRVCKDIPIYRSVSTKNGDGTVVGESAAYDDGTVISLQLGDDSVDADLGSKSHASILAADSAQKSVGEIVTHANSTSDHATILGKLSVIPGVSIGEKNRSDTDMFTRQLIVSTHSPVRLDVYDDLGNHTGEIAPPSGTEAGLYIAYEEKIPGSKYERTGDEAEPDTYISIPENGKKYSVVIRGVGTGEFSYEIERQRGVDVVDKVSYVGLPTTPLMLASTSIMTESVDSTIINSSTSTAIISLASSSVVLNIDIDGDNIIDTKIVPNNKPDRKLFLKLLRKSLEKGDDREHHTRELIKEVEKRGRDDEDGERGEKNDRDKNEGKISK